MLIRIFMTAVVAVVMLFSARSEAQLLQTDENNCGAVGYVCAGGRECISGICSPAWLEMSTVDAPAARGYAASANLDGAYVVAGGCTTTEPESAADSSAASYDPSTDEWGSAPSLTYGRSNHSMAAAGSGGDLYVYGGLPYCYSGAEMLGNLETLASVGGSWSEITTEGSPGGRYNTSMVWNGSRFVVYGGSTGELGMLADGALYSPGLDAWTATSCQFENCDRGGIYAGFLNGTMVQYWGGSPDGVQLLSLLNTWSSWSPPSGGPDFGEVFNGPPRFGDDGRRIYHVGNDANIYIYDRLTNSWSFDDAAMPEGLCDEGASAWIGSELITWGGLCGGELSSVGGRYQPPAPCHLNLLGACVL